MSFDKSVLLPYLSKIERRRPLSEGARAAFLALPFEQRSYEAGHKIIKERDRPAQCCLIIKGVVSCYKTFKNGTRQIASFHLAGDMVDLHAGLPTVAGHSIRTHTATTVVTIDCENILDLAAEYPEWAGAFWFDSLVDSSILCEWTANIGRRTAVARLAHLLLEFSARLEMTGQSDGKTFVLPVTQVDLADATGLSAVHTNRSIQQLRQSGAISTQRKNVVIEDYPALVSQASFDPAYLHLEGPGW